ncbi:MAG: TraB/GumN family protein [Candidatus Diapherotrites archaeon]|jgi:pheromone shutdown-related protein TraB|uniref:TraB/GumN family protein n=1 Tax=Candidatus Iainarchaeum sp. TaxID=3101447 RepID=A0A8T5GH81_9ARCH|nr:TraB/GumN family protein [Candidatus Diapherotrites archaeon]MBT7241483.1 TraB/GumN family protein [Candidatus Diapherotrites archaeon]
MIRKIKFEDKQIILVGTAHISRESMKLVEETIDKEKPDVIGVELDKERLEQLLSGKKWEQTNIIDIIKTGKTYLFLLNILLSNLQKQLGKSVGVKPGAEMLVAVKKAQESKTPVQLLDRNVRVTLKRAFKVMSLKEKLKLGGTLVAGFFGKGETIDAKVIEDLKDQDLINKLMKELGKQMPSMKQVLVDERDQYIAEMIKRSPGKRIVAIVGAGHLNGIEEIIKKNKKVNIKKITSIPKKRNYIRFLKWLVPLAVIAMFVGLFLLKGPEITFEALKIWFLANGILSGVGALLAKAHPFSILTAILVAPFTSLHPMLAAGWVTALVEAKFNPPRVMDFKNLSGVTSVKGFYNNKVTHLLIVTALTNLGSIIGTIIALPALVALLA